MTMASRGTFRLPQSLDIKRQHRKRDTQADHDDEQAGEQDEQPLANHFNASAVGDR